MWGRCRIKEDIHNGNYFTVGLNISPRHEHPTQPYQPPTVCLPAAAHEYKHPRLRNLTVVSRPIRQEVTLLLFPPSAGPRDNPCQRGATAAPPPSQTTGSSRAEAHDRGHAVEGAWARAVPRRPLSPGWMSTWAISAADSTRPWGLTAGRGCFAQPNPERKKRRRESTSGCHPRKRVSGGRNAAKPSEWDAAELSKKINTLFFYIWVSNILYKLLFSGY